MKVLKFGAVWCSGCLVMRPRWAEIEKEHPWLKTEYFDYDKDKKMVDKYDIQSGKLPVFVFLNKKGQEFLRKSGEPNKQELVKIILANQNR
jgi:thiol-disulfide isomerase/thioredoxin